MSNRVSRKESEEVAQRILESIDDIKNSVPSILKNFGLAKIIRIVMDFSFIEFEVAPAVPIRYCI